MVCKASIILPFQWSAEREALFYACLSNLVRLLGNDVEICVHEVGPERHLDLPSKYKYLYTRYKGVFHRAWALNRGVRKLATSNKLVIMDSDLIVSYSWIKEMLDCKTQSIAWGKLSLLNKEGTKIYLGSIYIDRLKIKQTKSPSMGSAAGGAMIVPKKLFYNIGGIPEDFMGSWGGEDNAFWAKLIQTGHKIGRFKSEIFHLDHSKSTPRVSNIQKKVVPMLQWKKVQWRKYIDLVGNSWGNTSPETYKTPNVEIVSKESGIKLTIAMLSWLRYDKLISTLNSLYNTLTIPINLVLMVQGSELLLTSQRRTIRSLANKFAGNDLFFTKGNIGTGPARSILVKRALNRFHTPYINLGDDDTTYTKGSVESAIETLENDRSIGVVSIRYKDKIYVLDSQHNPYDLLPTVVRSDKDEVDCTGSASAFIRREVFDLCEIDSFYIIGYWDLDLFLQIRSIGWKIVNCETFEGMKAINNWGGSIEYRKARTNKVNILKGRAHFKSVWGLRKTI